MDNKATTEVIRKTSKIRNNRWLVVGALVLFVAVTVFIKYIVMPGSDGRDESLQQTSESYLTNNLSVVCLAESTDSFKCHNLDTQEVKQISLPEDYHKVERIIPSADGTKMLIISDNNAVIVDSNFKKIREITGYHSYMDAYPTYVWADKGSKILIREVKYEDNDTIENPPPVVISMFDIETGAMRRVYKTGESVDPQEVQVIGGNNEYIFIILPAAKNWVAQSVDSPPCIINAVRISDGLVRQVNSSQIDVLEDSSGYNYTWGYYYDDQRDALFFVGNEIIQTAYIEDSAQGLTLKKVDSLLAQHEPRMKPVITSKGIGIDNLKSDNWLINFVDGDGNTNDEVSLQLVYSERPFVVALAQMPSL